MATQIQVVRIKDGAIMGTSRDIDVFGRLKGSMMARVISFDIVDSYQRGYYKCTLKTAHGTIISSRSIFLQVEGMYRC